LISVGRRHGVPDRLERFQTTLDPGVKTSSRVHHAHCGAARCDRIAANRRYAGSCLLATMWTRLSGGPAIVGAGQTVCLENRQHVAACEQVFGSDSRLVAGRRPRLSGINGLSGWHASCFGQWQRSIVPAIASGWRATHL